MNNMNMPGFTAEDSLYKTSGHYRTGRPAFTSLTHAIRAFHPAAEIIEVYGCPPGTIPWIEGETAVCILTEPSWGGGGQSPGEDGGFGDTEPYGGGPGKRPRKTKGRPTSKPKQRQLSEERCTPAHHKTEKGQKCQKRADQDLMNNLPYEMSHRLVCGKELSEVLCCIPGAGEGQYICDVEQV